MAAGVKDGRRVGGTGSPGAVLVTGACGGLGGAVVQALADRGYRVFAADMDRAGLARRSWPSGVTPLEMDVTDTRSVRRAMEQTGEVAASLRGLVCCAGLFVGGPLVEVEPERVLRVLDVNVAGAQRTAAAALPLLSKSRGTIVLISSEVVRCAVPFTGPYMMSKCALEAFASTLRRELLRLGVGVAVVRPGAIRTDLLRGAEDAFGGMEAASAFSGPLRRARAALHRERETGMEPAAAARVVVRALENGGRRRLYSVRNDLGRAVLGLLPPSLGDALIRRFMK